MTATSWQILAAFTTKIKTLTSLFIDKKYIYKRRKKIS